MSTSQPLLAPVAGGLAQVAGSPGSGIALGNPVPGASTLARLQPGQAGHAAAAAAHPGDAAAIAVAAPEAGAATGASAAPAGLAEPPKMTGTAIALCGMLWALLFFIGFMVRPGDGGGIITAARQPRASPACSSSHDHACRSAASCK